MAILVGMDEILIDEKKYVSSKQAAKITGYAKDYIGQLCREGRVPARLVGRSWYVLESAIQDHRFGDTSSHTEAEEAVKAPSPAPTLPWTQQPPRYQAAPIDVLPTAERAAEPVESTEVGVKTDPNAPDTIQNSWKAWFDRVGQTFQQEAGDVAVEERFETQTGQQEVPESPIEAESTHEEEVFEEKYEDTEVNVPIHAVYKAPPRELLPRYSEEISSYPAAAEEEIEEESPVVERARGRKRGYGLVKFVALVLALAAASVAALGSGYLDTFIVSVTPVHQISGLEVYEK
jgi:hypothetical protein